MAILSRVAAISPFGPIFGKELRTTSRRKRTYILRSSYLILLLLALLIAWLSAGRMSYGGLAQRAQRQAELGAVFFAVFSFFCVITMGLIGPVLTATAIGSERLAKTLPVLLMSPINTWQIIGGKLFSRLLVALTLLGLSLPVLALVRLLGGVELSQMLAVMAICTTFVLATAAIGLFYSSLMNRAYAVILLSFATLGFLYAFVPFILALTLFRRERDALPVFASINPPFAIGVQVIPDSFTSALRYTWLPCSIVNLVLTALLVLASAAILRRIARTAGEKPTAANPDARMEPLAALSIGPGVPIQLPGNEQRADDDLAATPAPPPPLPLSIPYAGPLRHDRSMGERIVLFPFWLIGWPFGIGPLANRATSRDVFENAVLWREVKRPLLARPWQRITATALCIGLLLVIYGALADGNDLHRPDTQIGFAIILHGLAWLLVAILSSTGIASEKESDTWTLLLATPLTGKQTVWGKVAGLCRRLFWPMMLVFGHFLIFVVTGILHPGSIVLILWVMITFNLPWLAIGLWLSLRMRRVTFAVITNLMLTIVICSIPPAILFVVGEAVESRDLPEHTLWYIPYYFLGEGLSTLNREYHNYGHSNYNYDYFYSRYRLPGGSRVDAPEFFTAVFIIGVMHVLVALLILSRTAGAFDQIVGRAGKLAYLGSFDTDEAVISTRAESLAPVWRRLAARIVDNGILAIVGGVAGLIFGLVLVFNGQDQPLAGRAESTIAYASLIGMAIAIVSAWPYFAGFECSRWRATPGKSLMRIFVTDMDGRRISFLRASGRFFGAWISGAMLGIGYLFAFANEQRQTLHDKLAGTVVLHR